MKTKILLVISFISLNFVVYGENKHKIDSLIKELPLAEGIQEVDIYKNLAWEYRRTDQKQAVAILNDGIKLAKLLKYHEGWIDCITYKGVVYRYIDNFKEAFENYIIALKLSEKYDYKKGKAYALLNIGEVLHAQKDHYEGINYVKKALPVFLLINDLLGESYVYIRLGEIYEEINKLDSALIFYKKALFIRQEKLKDLEGVSGINSRLGEIYLDLGKLALAKLHFDKSDVYQQNQNNKHGIMRNLIGYAKISFAKREYESAIKNLNKAKNISKEIHSLEYWKKTEENLANTYESLQQYALAYASLKQANILEDSLNDVEIKNTINKLKTDFELAQYENIEELKIKNIEIKTKDHQILALSIYGVVISILCIFLFVIIRKKQSKIILR
jgi:tetratricopeptide (TPR) repeat protein